jgi:F0F1-type ATP synthase epsilon subunit
MSKIPMKLVLFLNKEKRFDGDVLEIVVHTENGDVTILSGHVPYISRICSYVSFSKDDDQKETHEINDGFIYTNGEICFVVAE